VEAAFFANVSHRLYNCPTLIGVLQAPEEPPTEMMFAMKREQPRRDIFHFTRKERDVRAVERRLVVPHG
jgi:hypothetical protein